MGKGKIEKTTRKKELPQISQEDFLSAVGLVMEKEGQVTIKLLRKYFYQDQNDEFFRHRLKRLEKKGILVEKVPWSGGRGVERILVFANKPGNGSWREQPASVLPPPKPKVKALPQPANGDQPHAELRSLVARAIDRLEEFQERYQPLLASLLDLERDMEAFEQLAALLGNIKTQARTGLSEIRPVGTGWRN